MQLSMNLSMELSMELSIDVGRLLLSGMSVRKNSDSCDYFEWNFRDAGGNRAWGVGFVPGE